MNPGPRHRLGAIAALTLILALPVAAAEPEYPPDFADGLAGGPDYWAVANVPANDVLNVRADAGTSYDVIGALTNGDLGRNRGCFRKAAWRCMTATAGRSRLARPALPSSFDSRRKRLRVIVPTDRLANPENIRTRHG